MNSENAVSELWSCVGVLKVLDGLGLGAGGPPVPPPATFAVVPYPVNREVQSGIELRHFSFLPVTDDL